LISLPSYDHTSTLLEDVFEPITDPYCPVVVIDFKVYAHAINKYAQLASEVAKDEKELRTIMKAMWAYKLNRGPDMLRPFPFVGVVVDDLKGRFDPEFSEASTTGVGYWRHIEAHKLDLAEYKGGRGEKTPHFDLTEAAGYEYILSKGSSFPYFAKEFFEADDIAGHICRLKRKARKGTPLSQRQIILSTVDGDWQGLVSDSHGIVWANTGPWLPRLRSEREVCDYYLRKDKFVIESAYGCYIVKENLGDAGDNLLPGTPLRFFDLYNEDTEWRFTKEDTKTLSKVLNSDLVSDREDHLLSARNFLRSKGLFMPEIGETHHDEKQFFLSKARKVRLENSNPELRGKNKTLCLSVAEELEMFDKCKKLVVEQEDLKLQIKEQTEQVSKCKEKDDKKCVKDLRITIKRLKELKDSIVKDLKSLVSVLDD
jgi:hypothetical protein